MFAEKNKKKRKIVVESIASYILVGLLLVITLLTEIEFDLSWYKNINIWIDDFFVNTFVFFIMSTLLHKIRNEYINFGISYVISIIIGNSIHFDASNADLTWRLVIYIVFDFASIVLWGQSGFNKGKRKAQEEEKEAKKRYIQKILEMDNETRSRLYNLKRFIKKHPQECAAIEEVGINFVMNFVEDDKIIRATVESSNISKTESRIT